MLSSSGIFIIIVKCVIVKMEKHPYYKIDEFLSFLEMNLIPSHHFAD